MHIDKSCLPANDADNLRWENKIERGLVLRKTGESAVSLTRSSGKKANKKNSTVKLDAPIVIFS